MLIFTLPSPLFVHHKKTLSTPLSLADFNGTSQPSMNCSDAEFLFKRESIRVTVGVTCVLSMIGASLIIISFLCFKHQRSPTRFILFNISIMDFLVALANFVGDVGDFDKYYINRTSTKYICETDDYGFTKLDSGMMITPPTIINTVCVAQATVALYSTLSSVLWTISLAVYLYFLITQSKTQAARYSIYFSLVFCYGMPLFITLWMLLTHKLGYSPYNAAGWCSMIIYDPENGDIDRFLAVFGYDLWIYLTMFLIVVLYFGLRIYLAVQERTTRNFFTEKKFWDAVHSLDYKFMLIPFFFILLRIWSCIIDILMYAEIDIHKISWVVALVLILLSGIGDSGQGMVNGFLFVMLTKPVRRQMINAICCKWKTLSLSASHSIQKSNREVPDERTPFFSSYEEINNS